MHTRRFFGFLVAAAGVLVILGGLASTASSAPRPGVHAFEAHLRDVPCPGGVWCGTGTLTGFGHVKTRLQLRGSIPRPARGCVGVTGARRLTLTSDAKSTLQLAVEGAACEGHSWGTFEVDFGRGVFRGATGSGVIIGTLSKTRHESLRFWGVLTLAGR